MSNHLPEMDPSLWHLSWLNKACITGKDSESEWLAKDNLETNPITIKPKTVSHMAERFSWVTLPYCSPPACPFPIKSLALSAHVSPRTIHFQVLDNSPFRVLEGVPLRATLPLMLLRFLIQNALLNYPPPVTPPCFWTSTLFTMIYIHIKQSRIWHYLSWVLGFFGGRVPYIDHCRNS